MRHDVRYTPVPVPISQMKKYGTISMKGKPGPFVDLRV
jgi:hypothetical protein